jgi:hypothetical protein
LKIIGALRLIKSLHTSILYINSFRYCFEKLKIQSEQVQNIFHLYCRTCITTSLAVEIFGPARQISHQISEIVAYHKVKRKFSEFSGYKKRIQEMGIGNSGVKGILKKPFSLDQLTDVIGDDKIRD